MKKLFVGGVVLIISIGLFFFFKDEHTSFDRKVWLSSKHCKPVQEANKRLPMVKDLVATSLKEKKRNEIVSLLGEPESAKVLPNVKRDLIYCLGQSYALTMNWLVIHLDDDGKFSKYEIVKAD